MSKNYKKFKIIGYCLVAIALTPIVILYIVGIISGCEIEGISEGSSCSPEVEHTIGSLFLAHYIIGGLAFLPGLGLILVGSKVPQAYSASPLTKKMDNGVRWLWGFVLFLLILAVLINVFKYLNQ